MNLRNYCRIVQTTRRQRLGFWERVKNRYILSGVGKQHTQTNRYTLPYRATDQ